MTIAHEPIIKETMIAITRAIGASGGRLEYYEIPLAKWDEFQAAYTRQFGAPFAAPIGRLNLVLCGVPVCPRMCGT